MFRRALFEVEMNESQVAFSLTLNPSSRLRPTDLINREALYIPTNLPPAWRDAEWRRVKRNVRATFDRDVRRAILSAVIQNSPEHPLHEEYGRKARENRERLEAERKQEAEELKRLRRRAA